MLPFTSTEVPNCKRAKAVIDRVVGAQQQGEGVMLHLHFSREGLVLSAGGDTADPLPVDIINVPGEVRSKQHLAMDTYGLEMHGHERLIITDKIPKFLLLLRESDLLHVPQFLVGTLQPL